MKTATYRQAQTAYDRQEHPDYWDDREEDDDRGAIIGLMFSAAMGPRLANRREQEAGRWT